jgi:endothelin-converting enzyme/putative endopeptidase
MFELAGDAPAAAKTKAASIFAFEKRLAEASLDNVALRDPKQQDHKMSFAELQKLTPAFDWGAYFDANGLPREDLNVTQPAFLKRFDEQLASASVSEWRDYLEWIVLNNAADRLSKPFVEQNFAFYGKYLSGATSMKPRAIRCAEGADGQIGEALGKAYVEKYFPPEAKARMQDMVKNILLAMGDTIRGLEWMSDATKAKAQEKLSTFAPKIGYPDKWKDYRGMQISRASYWDNAISAQRWAVADNRSEIGKPVDRSKWGMTPPTSNAYYNPSLNEIVFPAGILQPPGFTLEATDAVNYGSIGVVIGHEISHGFDDQGSKSDWQGIQQNWWTDADRANFQKKVDALGAQFDTYCPIKDTCVNGKLTMGENIGDLGGLSMAYTAYKLSLKGKEAPVIDGLTGDQRFFMAWAQVWKSKYRDEALVNLIKTNPHSPAMYRINGPLRNLAEWYAAYGIKEGDKLYIKPEDRVRIW